MFPAIVLAEDKACEVGKYWNPTSNKFMPCQEGWYCPGTGTNNNGLSSCELACPYGLTSDAGASSINECYVNLTPGQLSETWDDGYGIWDGGAATCPGGWYCPGGKYTVADECVDLGSSFEGGYLLLGAFECPGGTTSNDGASDISQCCSTDGKACIGDAFRIDFVYSADKVVSVSPSIYFGDWYYREEFGKNFYLIGNGNNVGSVDVFPVPKYKSDSGIRFMGWYTEPDGKGTQIAGPDGLTSDGKMPSNTLFKAATTLYAYEKTGEECRVGQYFNGTEYVSCPENYYCPGVGTTPLDTPGCRVACPAGTVNEYMGGTSAEDCHTPCPEHTNWDSAEKRCKGNQYCFTFEKGNEYLSSSAAYCEIYGEYFEVQSRSGSYQTEYFPVTTKTHYGWYTEPNCQGTRVSDAWVSGSTSTGSKILVAPDFFTEHTTLYPCYGWPCTAGKYYNGTTDVDCPKDMYCPGGEVVRRDTAGCGAACPRLTCDGTDSRCFEAQLTTASTGATSLAQCTYELPLGVGYSAKWANSDGYFYRCGAGYFRGVDDYSTGASGAAWENGKIKDGLVTPVVVTGEHVVTENSAPDNVYCSDCAYFGYSSAGEGACHAPNPGYRTTGCGGGPGHIDCTGQEACPAGTYLVSWSSVASYGVRGKECATVPAGSYTTDCYETAADGTPMACAGTATCPTGDGTVVPAAGTGTSGQACCAADAVWTGEKCSVQAQINFSFDRMDLVTVNPNIGTTSEFYLIAYPLDNRFVLYINNKIAGSLAAGAFPVLGYYVDSNKSFVGWYTEPNGGGTRVMDGAGNALVDAEFFRGKNNTTVYALVLGQCKAGITQIKTGSGVVVPLYDKKAGAPALAVGYAGQVCYGQLAEGAQSGAINVTKDGKTYHSVN